MGLAGFKERHYCNYCEVRGIYREQEGHMHYCPLFQPQDAENTDWRTYGSLNFQLRDHADSEEWAEHVEQTGYKETTKLASIACRTIFWDLESIIFPCSYGIDAANLFYKDIAVQMRDHWAARFPLGGTGNSESETDSDGEGGQTSESYSIRPNV